MPHCLPPKCILGQMQGAVFSKQHLWKQVNSGTKTGFCQKIHTFSAFTHFVTDCSSHVSEWGPRWSFNPAFLQFLCKVSKLRFPLVLTWCLFAESPTTIKCHLSPFYVPLFCNSSKQNLSYKWSQEIFHQFCYWPKLASCNISST